MRRRLERVTGLTFRNENQAATLQYARLGTLSAELLGRARGEPACVSQPPAKLRMSTKYRSDHVLYLCLIRLPLPWNAPIGRVKRVSCGRGML
jgi:hypothetical protein